MATFLSIEHDGSGGARRAGVCATLCQAQPELRARTYGFDKVDKRVDVVADEERVVGA
jgi:hypothetical protein